MRLGIDLGGTKIEGIALRADGSTAARIRTATPAGDYHQTLRSVARLLRELETDAGILDERTPSPRPVGVAIPGSVNPETQRIKNANSTCLIGRPLGDDLQDILKRPVRLENDANCFMASEAKDGAACGHAVAFGLILGTGVGGAIAVNGTVLRGGSGLAGEWGHIPLPWPKVSRATAKEDHNGDSETPGPPCYCGRSGCIETFLCGPGLAAEHARRTPEHLGLTPEEIVAQAHRGDAAALETLKLYENRLARGLAVIINILDPDIIVVGGGLSNIERLYKNIPRLWDAWVFGGTCTTRFVRNAHGDSSGVRGAAWLWPETD